jgi:uncharacterized membrane protein YphA (DoxX/SURF4 family)
VASVSESRWRPWLGRAGAFVLGAVLLVATVAKAIDPQAFAEQMQVEGLTFGMPPLVAALLALAIEGALGLALVLGIRRWSVLGPAALLVAFFVFLNARSWWLAAHGAAPEGACGCFGNLVLRSPQAAFWQDLLLLVPPLLLAVVGREAGEPLPRRRMLAATAGVAALVLLAWRAPELPLDDVATRLRPGVELASLCAAGESPVCLADVVPELQGGRWWVTLVDVDDDPEQWVDALNAAGAGAATPVVALTASSSDAVRAFTWQWGPSFTLREAPAPLLRPLHRRLPRSFLTDEGRVVATTPGLPPVAAVAQGDLPR